MIFFYASKKEKKRRNFFSANFLKNKRNASGWAGVSHDGLENHGFFTFFSNDNENHPKNDIQSEKTTN